MVRKSKRDKARSIAVTVVAQNIIALRDDVFAHERTVTGRNIALAKASDTSLSQIQRIVDQEVAVGVDMLESISRALRVEPRDLLTPYFRRRTQSPTDPGDQELQRRPG